MSNTHLLDSEGFPFCGISAASAALTGATSDPSIASCPECAVIRSETPCTCATDGSARRCRHHTQADYDAADDHRTLTEAERAEITQLFGYVPEPEPLEQMLAAVARIKAEASRRVLAPDGSLWAETSSEAERYQP